MAGKKHYFGVGGGTRQFLHVVKEDGKLKFSTNMLNMFTLEFYSFFFLFFSIFGS